MTNGNCSSLSCVLKASDEGVGMSPAQPQYVRGLCLEIIKRSEQAKGFVLLAKRWVVERTFGGLMKSRRHNCDHEHNPRHHESLVYLVMIKLNLRSLSRL